MAVSVSDPLAVPASAPSAVGPRRLFSNVQIRVKVNVQADGTVATQLHTRPSSKAERRTERRDRKFELLHANRQQKRKEYKQRRKQHKQQQKDTQPQPAPSAPAVRRGKLYREWVRSRQTSSPLVCLDCQWEAAMVETEVQSLSKQLKFLYADNMHTPHPLRIALTSYGHTPTADDHTTTEQTAAGEAQAGEAEGASGLVLQAPRLCMYMARIEGFDRWLMTRTPLHYTRAFAAHSSVPSTAATAVPPTVTYLTAESPNLLTHLQAGAVYVVGALVDHNRLPGMCHAAAVAAGVVTARLPITECMRVEGGSRRTVITVNQVFDCLLRWWNMHMERSGQTESSGEQQQQQQQQRDGGEETWQLRWAAAFHTALPKRGGWQVREEWSAAISQSEGQLPRPQS